MVRWSVLTAMVVLVVGAALVAGASVPPKVGPGPDAVKAMPNLAQKIGFFNMAKLMREYRRARTSADRLTAKRMRMVKNMMGLRAMHGDLRMLLETVKHDTDQLFRLNHELIVLTRQIEDSDREINKMLQNQASLIISEIYDEVYATSTETAREHGLSALLAYPDAVTPEERDNPMLKEMKLKPPAAQPFYLDPAIDYTDELIERLNNKFTAEPAAN